MSGHHWLIVELGIVAMAGVISHELAHWLVWWLAGRRPHLDLRALDVEPRAGPIWTTRADRMAAAAPYLLGTVAVLIGLVGGRLDWLVYGAGAMIYVSRQDIWTIRGWTRWQVTLEWETWNVG